MSHSEPHSDRVPSLNEMAAIAKQCLTLSTSRQEAPGLFDKLVPTEVTASTLLARANEIAASYAEINNLLALAYERERSFAQALPYLQILRRLFPKSFDFSLRFGKVCAALGRYVDAEASLNDAIELNGNEYWAHYERGMLFLRFNNYQAGYRYFRTFVKRWPNRPQGYMRLLDAAFELRLWQESIAICETVIGQFPVVAERASTMASLARSYLTLSLPVLSNQKRSCFFINLDRDRDRHEKMLDWYEELGISIERVTGAVGSALPKTFLKSSMAKDCDEAGTIGCFLAHMKTWEVVANRNVEALIVEDDAFPIYDFSSLLEGDVFPSDYDLIFVNDGMSLVSYKGKEVDKLDFYAVSDVLVQRPPQQRGIGLQGYILSPRGARKLLDLVQIDGVKGHVDWQVAAYAITKSDISRLQTGSVMSVILPRYVDVTRSTPAITAYCAYPAFVRHRDYGTSTRRSGN